MKGLWIGLAIGILLSHPLGAQELAASATQWAAGNIRSVGLSDFSASNTSIAALHGGTQVNATVARLFNGSGIKTFYIESSHTFANLGSLRLGMARAGIPGFFRQEVALGYGRKLSQKIALGGDILFFSRKATGYESRRMISFRLTGLFPVSKTVQAGVVLSNPLPDRKSLPVSNFTGGMAAGVMWAQEKLKLGFEIEKRFYGTFVIKTGINYRPVQRIHLLAGIQTSDREVQPSFGIGYSIAGYSVNVAAKFHGILPPGLSAGLSYSTLNSK